MNYFKSFLLTVSVLFTLAACDTDDLRNDVDDLKGRVESLEAQVSLLNDNMTAIKRLLEGGQTITEVTTTTNGYTLKLSDGETITLTQGSEGKVKYPEITVNDEGQWVVNGEVLMQNGMPVQAVGTPGNDGTTPKFRIADEGGYWQVSYDNESTWEFILDEDGNKVSAISDGSGESSSDSFFESAGIDESGEFFVVKLKGQDEAISIPIVKDLLCEIIEPAEGMNNGYWEIGYGQTVSTTVKVKGDNVMVTAPAGWVATISEANGQNEATLTITAPASAVAANTRATADNSSDVTVQVNKGANWAVDKIQVKAIQIIESYYALYEAGENIEIGNISIDKSTFGESVLISQDSEISTDGIYFIQSDAKITIAKKGFNKLILIADSPSAKISVKNNQAFFNITETNANFIAKNIEFTTTAKPFMQIASTGINMQNLILENCKINITEGSNFLNAHNGDDNAINNISLTNNTFAFPVTADWKATRIFNLQNKDLSASIVINNNVFYTTNKNYLINGTILFMGSTEECGIYSGKAEISHNTFINFVANSQSLVRSKVTGEVSFTNLLFWHNSETKRTGTLINTQGAAPGMLTFDMLINYVTDNSQEVTYSHFNGTVPEGYKNTQIELTETDPFDGGTFDLENGIFIPNAEYAGYGASIN